MVLMRAWAEYAIGIQLLGQKSGEIGVTFSV
jgi:hypothetical protein